MKKSHETVRIDFSEEQIAEKKERIADLLQKKRRMELAFADVRKEHQENKKPIDAELGVLLEDIENGSRYISGEFQVVPNYVEKVMEIYDEEGNLVGSRSMTRAESQMEFTFKVG